MKSLVWKKNVLNFKIIICLIFYKNFPNLNSCRWASHTSVVETFPPTIQSTATGIGRRLSAAFSFIANRSCFKRPGNISF